MQTAEESGTDLAQAVAKKRKIAQKQTSKAASTGVLLVNMAHVPCGSLQSSTHAAACTRYMHEKLGTPRCALSQCHCMRSICLTLHYALGGCQADSVACQPRALGISQ